LAFATFLVLRLRIGACGVGACYFGAYDSYQDLFGSHRVSIFDVGKFDLD